MCETTLGEFTPFLCVRRPEIFRKLRKSFARFGRKLCAVPTPGASYYYSLMQCGFVQLSATLCSMRNARWLSACNFCARGVPDFQKFCKIFARFLRKFCVISTLDSRAILHQNELRFKKELQRSAAVCESTLGEFTQFLCVRRPEIFRKLRKSFARYGRKICVIPTPGA